MDELQFDGLVAVVTGAGQGLGRAHALLLGSRGAPVVVNDLGHGPDGQATAEIVAGEIRAAGGTAVASVASVADAEGIRAIVDTAHDAFGPIDLLVNNAGIGGAAGLRRLTVEELRRALAVHLEGSVFLTQAAWDDLCQSEAGAVVNTSSGVGLFGLPGATAYAAAKMAIIGATKVLALEGARHGVRVNAIAPMAKTEMAGDVYGELGDRLDPRLVASVVAWLLHPSCELTGQVLSAGGGRVARVGIEVGAGSYARGLTPEDVAAMAPELVGAPTLPMSDALAEAQLIADLIADHATPS